MEFGVLGWRCRFVEYSYEIYDVHGDIRATGRKLNMFSFAKKLVDRLDGAQGQNRTDSYFKDALLINNNGYGLRVLKVTPHSAAHLAGLESWFDYIIRVNGHELPMMYPSLSNFSHTINEDGLINYGGQTTAEQAGMINVDLLVQELKSITSNDKASNEITLDVWSAKGGIIRQVHLPLNKPLGAAGDSSLVLLFENLFAETGVILQSQHLNTATYVWRILQTHMGSPAFQAQLVPHSDYIIGCDSAVLDDQSSTGLLTLGGEATLSRTVLNYYNQHYLSTHDDHVPITFYVYNHDYDILRPVTVNLSRSWGTGHNKGVLGCDVGYGLLHRVPEVIGKFTSHEVVDDLLFENKLEYIYGEPPEPVPPPAAAPGPDAFVPVRAANAAPPPPRAAGKKKKHVAPASGAGNLQDYMNEELAKSKEHDVTGASSPNKETAPPPPPPTSST